MVFSSTLFKINQNIIYSITLSVRLCLLRRKSQHYDIMTSPLVWCVHFQTMSHTLCHTTRSIKQWFSIETNKLTGLPNTLWATGKPLYHWSVNRSNNKVNTIIGWPTFYLHSVGWPCLTRRVLNKVPFPANPFDDCCLVNCTHCPRHQLSI